MGLIGLDYGKDDECVYVSGNILLLTTMFIMENNIAHFIIKIWKLKISLIFNIEQ
tara:strand:+ start:741 stop:905 length:165 start_codon:yes stop_codon:yes gene_type:complete